ncbi:MAG: baseplate J/gp47 family protein [Lachnospiraceae bacterium]
MLPIISLDDERFEEIAEKARKMIPSLYPDWTDYNYHDPGITMLEMLAWLKEIQQFHMDQIGQQHLRKYYMLLGETLGNRTPAKTQILVSDAAGAVLQRGSRFYANEIPFETENARFLTASRIRGLMTLRAGDFMEAGDLIHIGEGTMQIPVFGENPKGGEGFYIGLTAPLETGREHLLYFRFYDGYPVKRNPINGADSFVPLAAIDVEYLGETGFTKVDEWQDETSQMLENGYIRLRIHAPMVQGCQGLYWLRISFLEGEYDTAPVLEQLTLHGVDVRQLDTLSECIQTEVEAGQEAVIQGDSCLARYGNYEIYVGEKNGFRLYEGEVLRELKEEAACFHLLDLKQETRTQILLLCYEEEFESARFLGEGDGFPDQEFDGGIQDLCRQGMVLLAETFEGSHVFRIWEQAEDFTGSASGDCHYCYDEKTGRFSFGNGDRGCVPEGRMILAAACTSLGLGGNVKTGAINRYEGELDVREITNPEGASGGRNSETMEECSFRLHQNLKRTQRAVTYQDYEILIRQTPGLRIESVKAIPVTEKRGPDGVVDEKKVTVVVKPYTTEPRPRPSRAYLNGILNMLESRRLLGTKINILSPEYIGVTVFAEIETDSYYQKTKEQVREALEAYFAKRDGQFGQPILYGEVYGIIDVLEHVTHVRSVSLDAQGSKIKRNRNGDILLPVNGLAYLKEWDCMISSAR